VGLATQFSDKSALEVRMRYTNRRLYGGHTVMIHGGQQRGRGPRPCSIEGARGREQTDTHMIRPLYDDAGKCSSSVAPSRVCVCISLC